MLPFPKRASRNDEQELDECDLVEVVAISPETADDTQEIHDAPTVARINLDELEAERKSVRTLLARKPFDSDLEDDVAGDILASIGKESQRVSVRSITPSTVPPPPSRPSRPMLRAQPSVGTVPGVVPSAPRMPVFARSYPTPAPSQPRVPTLPYVAPESIAPVAAPPARKSEPSVILVRERKPLGWIVASGVVGAAIAVLATRIVAQPAPAPPAAVSVVVAAAPPPPTTVVPAAPTVSAQPVAMTFEDGVSIPAASASAAPAASAPKKKKKLKAPMVPDQPSLAAPPASTAAVTPAPVAPAPAPQPMTPTSPNAERDLAAAQLKSLK